MSSEALDSRTTSASQTAEPPPVRRAKRPTWVAYLPYLIPGAIGFIVVIGIPFATNIVYSFQKWKGGLAPHHWVGLDNYRALLQDEQFWTSFRNSISMIVAMVIVPTLLGLVVAAILFDLIGKKFGARLASFLRATYYLPQLLPVAIGAVVIGWILRPQNSALNTVLQAVGLGSLQHNWLGDPSTALLSIMFVMVWVQIGYPVVIFMAALQRVDPELYEAAELDGAGWFQRFRSITVHIIRPEIFVVTLTCTIAALKVFGPIFTLTRGGPGNATIVPSYYSYNEFFNVQQVGYGATIATALTVVIVLLTIAFIKAQQRAEEQDR